MNFHESLQPGVEEQLWQVAFACAERRESMHAELEEEYECLQNTSIAGRGLLAKEQHAEQEQKYWTKHTEAQGLADFENDLLKTLEGMADGTVSAEEASSYLPQEPSDTNGASVSKRKRALLAELIRSGIDPRQDYYSLMSWDLLYGADPGRLTTGRNRTRLVTNGAVGSFAAQIMFHDQTADTHGGKVRKAGKDGKRYTNSAGKQVRKY